MQTLSDVEHEAFLARKAADVELAFLRVFQKRPELNCEANKKLILDFLAGEYEPTVETITQALDYLESRVCLAVRTPQQVQGAILVRRQELLGALRETNASKEMLMKAERMSNDQLEVTLNNIRERNRLDKLSRKDLKAAVQEEFAQVHPDRVGRQFDSLPENITALEIKRMSAPQIRDLQKQFGNDAVNARLQNRG
jgi:hypothetical protein